MLKKRYFYLVFFLLPIIFFAVCIFKNYSFFFLNFICVHSIFDLEYSVLAFNLINDDMKYLKYFIKKHIK